MGVINYGSTTTTLNYPLGVIFQWRNRPTILNQFRWGPETTDLTEFLSDLHSGHVDHAKEQAKKLINGILDSVCANAAKSGSLDLSNRVHKVKPDYDDHTDLSFFQPPPNDYGETRFGDKRMTQFQANASGLVNYWFEVRGVKYTINQDNSYSWSGNLVARDRLGVDSGDIKKAPLLSAFYLVLGAKLASHETIGSWPIKGGSASECCQK